jgi:hypothetical protein
MGIVVYFPAVAPPLAVAGVDDERRTPAPSEDVARKFATAVRRSIDLVCSLFAMAFLEETEYATVVLVDERNVKRMTNTAARKKRNIMMIAILDTVDE